MDVLFGFTMLILVAAVMLCVLEVRDDCPRCGATNKPRKYPMPSTALFFTCEECGLKYQVEGEQ